MSQQQIESRDDAIFEAAAGSAHATSLARHWLDATGGRLTPRKSDIRPEQLGRSVARIIIYDYVDRDTIRFRLAGTYFRSVHGRELTGTNFLALMTGEDRVRTSKRLFHMIGHPCGILTVNTSRFESGQSGEFRSFGLPLIDDEGRVTHSIHISDYLGGAPIPAFGKVDRMGAASSRWIDIGAGVPEEPPVI